jgi:hypothetical protein
MRPTPFATSGRRTAPTSTVPAAVERLAVEVRHAASKSELEAVREATEALARRVEEVEAKPAPEPVLVEVPVAQPPEVTRDDLDELRGVLDSILPVLDDLAARPEVVVAPAAPAPPAPVVVPEPVKVSRLAPVLAGAGAATLIELATRLVG